MKPMHYDRRFRRALGVRMPPDGGEGYLYWSSVW